MTTKEKLIEMLMNSGLSTEQANEVMELAIPVLDKASGNYKITYDRPSDEYVSPMYNIWFETIKPVVLQWIIKNKPQALFKPMFE